ncbi:MAG: flagellar motor switch phosphatase FliY [Peptococcia bacterium]
MNNNLLSQEEINVLLKETPDVTANAAQNEGTSVVSLNAMEKDVLGEIANISMGSAATALSSLLGKKTSITTPRISLTTLDKIRQEFPQNYLSVNVNYTSGLEGLNILIIHSHDASVFVDLMMEGDGSNPPQELSELHLSVISEAMEQMMNASTMALTQTLKKSVEMSSPVVNLATFAENNVLAKEGQDDVVRIAFDLMVEGLVDSEMLQILPISFAKQMVSELYKTNDDIYNNQVLENGEKNANFLSKGSDNVMGTVAKHVEVTPAEFTVFNEQTEVKDNVPSNLDLIMDIGLQLSVELGRTKKRIKEILKLTKGSIVELDKLAGEPVDILVNGSLLAKGEVVVIDENFGVRVTEIVSPTERIKNLK